MYLLRPLYSWTHRLSRNVGKYLLVYAAYQPRDSRSRLDQCFSTARPQPGTGYWHQLYRAARRSPEICHFSFLSKFSWKNVLYWKYSEEKNTRECVEKRRPRCWPEETTICYKISLVQWLITNLNVILYLSTCHTVYVSVLIFFMIMP